MNAIFKLAYGKKSSIINNKKRVSLAGIFFFFFWFRKQPVVLLGQSCNSNQGEPVICLKAGLSIKKKNNTEIVRISCFWLENFEIKRKMGRKSPTRS